MWKWVEWINSAKADPLVIYWAQKALELTYFIDQWWVRLAFAFLGVFILIWSWKPFLRLRHKLKFRWRNLLSEQVWISNDEALEVIKVSPWGKLRAPQVFEPSALSILGNTLRGSAHNIRGLTNNEKLLLKFDVYIDKTLNAFCSANPKNCRVNDDNKREIDEVGLNRFLDKAIETEVEEAFGQVPNHEI